MSTSPYMQEALRLAGSCTPRPNPRVGAVLVKDGSIIGRGAHAEPGKAHAEILAIQDAQARGYDPRGSELWVTLEPCCHSGPGKRTPPCAPELIARGITRVCCAMPDPNPQVSGRGFALLEAAGIPVQVGDGQAEAMALNREFTINQTLRRAYVQLKWAQTLDGKLADHTGNSRWISGEASRTEAHRLRAESQAVLVGAGTLRQDNPRLDVRHVQGSDPVPLILAGSSSLPWDSHLLLPAMAGRTWIIASRDSRAWEEAGLRDWQHLVAWDGESWHGLWEELYRLGIYSVLVEGGPQVLSGILESRAWDDLTVFVAPRILGGGRGLELAGRDGAPGLGMEGIMELADVRLDTCGKDLMITGGQTCSRV